MRNLLIILFTVFTTSANASDLCRIVNDSVLIAQDSQNTYLDNISNSFDSKSIFNEFGSYGSEFSSKSIWNEFATFGNEFNSYSPFNQSSISPPMIIKDKKIIGYLTVNEFIIGSVNPHLLKAVCDD